MNPLAPVVVFAYNRKDKIENCIRSLEKNEIEYVTHTDIFIFSDGAKSDMDLEAVDETRQYLDEYTKSSPFRTMTIEKAECNKGLARSVVDGVTKVVNRFGKVIVVEDDLVLAQDFLKFMNTALDFYESYSEIGQINGYTYPLKALSDYDKDVYFLRKGDCWGWGTWKDRWDDAKWFNVDFDEYRKDHKMRREFERTENNWDTIMMNQYFGANDSWAIRWVYHLFRNNLYAVYPRISRVINVGFDGSGTHGGKAGDIQLNDLLSEKLEMTTDIFVDTSIEKQAAKYPRAIFPLYILGRCKVGLKGIIKMLQCYNFDYDIQ